MASADLTQQLAAGFQTWIEPRPLAPATPRAYRGHAADGILERERSGYRASHIALYSSFQAAVATARSRDNQFAHATDKGSESR